MIGGFTSTSWGDNPEHGDRDIIFYIHNNPKGINIQPLSRNKKENEVLLPSHQKVKILNKVQLSEKEWLINVELWTKPNQIQL